MKFIVIPIEDAQLVFTEEELSRARKNVEGTEVIVHEEILLKKRQEVGLSTLPTDDTGEFEWTYPVYQDRSKELDDLLNSDDWTSKEGEV